MQTNVLMDKLIQNHHCKNDNAILKNLTFVTKSELSTILVNVLSYSGVFNNQYLLIYGISCDEGNAKQTLDPEP